MADEKPPSLGRYELREVLGRGAMGVVYKGYDSFLDRIVAVKTYRQDIQFPEEARKRFEREVRTASKLSHPNVVVVHDGGLEQGVPYLAMEYVEGPTLEHELERRGRLPREEALSILFAITDGLAYAHGRGVIHRDLKPANILLAPGGVPKIADFGVAKVLDAETSTKTMTVGTPRYMAPEQIEGKAVGPASDVFALGILAYELLTGARPFEADSLTTLMFRILSTEPTLASEVDSTLPKAVDPVLSHALAKDPAKRTPDAETFAAELRQACSGAATLILPPAAPLEQDPETTAFMKPLPAATLPSPPPPERSEPSTPRGGLPWIPIVIALLVVGGIIAYWLSGRSGSGPASTPAAAVTPTASPTHKAAPPVIATAIATTIPTVPAPAPTAKPPPTEQPGKPTATPLRRASPTTRPTLAPTKPPRPTAAPQQPQPSAPLGGDKAAASVEVISEPAGANVFFDGVAKGRTPIKVEGLPKGSHALEVRKEGYVSYDKTMNLDGSSDYAVHVTLPAAAAENGFVTVSSTPPGASVKLNGAPAGKTPVTLGPLEPGHYDITVESEGFPPQTRSIDMKPGALHDVKFRFGPP